MQKVQAETDQKCASVNMRLDVRHSFLGTVCPTHLLWCVNSAGNVRETARTSTGRAASEEIQPAIASSPSYSVNTPTMFFAQRCCLPPPQVPVHYLFKFYIILILFLYV